MGLSRGPRDDGTIVQTTTGGAEVVLYPFSVRPWTAHLGSLLQGATANGMGWPNQVARANSVQFPNSTDRSAQARAVITRGAFGEAGTDAATFGADSRLMLGRRSIS